ncbi:gamma-butyrobetaine hydroxylase-like domain-containing protein [Candidatus Methylopumilus universalis]|uniref:gamma-butyrobetaine hydroxylase-like domain-containing protein n=1 Tax=Candidatus Methylopumilus universalis TaxID=2588536 RepID=UPI003BEEC3B4
MTTSNAKIYPLEIKLHQSSKLLEIKFNNLTECMLSCEFLRVYSPSAEVRGHGPGQETLQIHKENVNIENIEPIGQYAIKLTFSDGHNTGIYSWDYLYELAATYDVLWEEYLRKLSIAGIQRTKTDVE